jgi:hypothetical protein
MAISHDDCTPFLSATLLNIEKPPVTVARLRTAILNQLQNAPGTGSITRTIHEVKAPTFQDSGLDVGWIHYSERRTPAWYAGDDLEEKHHHSVFIVKKAELWLFPILPCATRSLPTSEKGRSSSSKA